MKKLEILWELPKSDTKTQSEQMLLEKGANGLARHKDATHTHKNHSICEAPLNKAYLYCNLICHC